MIEAAIEVNNQRKSKYRKLISKLSENEQEFYTDNYTQKCSIPDLNAYENMPGVRPLSS